MSYQPLTFHSYLQTDSILIFHLVDIDPDIIPLSIIVYDVCLQFNFQLLYHLQGMPQLGEKVKKLMIQTSKGVLYAIVRSVVSHLKSSMKEVGMGIRGGLHGVTPPEIMNQLR
jgi:hypothetical protein